MTRSLAEKRRAFRALHQQGCFVLPNPWDVGSARLLQHLGFVALASSSAGFAWSQGRPDYGLALPSVLQHLTDLCAAVDLPINADFESGFAAEPEAVAVNVGLAIETGVAGLSIEDRDHTPSGLYDTAFAAERVRAAKGAIEGSGEEVILVARTELLLNDPEAVTPAIDRLVAFAEAGADCLFAPGVQKKADIVAMVRALAPKPINVVSARIGLSVAELGDLGVRRISVGGGLARIALGAVLEAAEQIQKSGSLDVLGQALPSKRLNDIFKAF